MDILNTASEPIFVCSAKFSHSRRFSRRKFCRTTRFIRECKRKHRFIGQNKKVFLFAVHCKSNILQNKKGFEHLKVSLAVVVQEMIDSDKSGVIFSKDPSYNNDNVHIEAVWGLGEGIVSGKITPDIYNVDRKLEILEKRLQTKRLH